jgi:hypothetical protein
VEGEGKPNIVYNYRWRFLSLSRSAMLFFVSREDPRRNCGNLLCIADKVPSYLAFAPRL